MIHVIADDPADASCEPWAARVEQFMDEITQFRDLIATLTVSDSRGRLTAIIQIQRMRKDHISGAVVAVSAERAEVMKGLDAARSRKSRVIDPA